MTLSLTPITPGSLAIGPVFNVTDGSTEVVRPGTVEFVGATVTESPAGTALVTVTGGSQTLTANLTTDPNTFQVDHVFDLGAGPHVALVTLTCLAVVPDGETFGTGSGEIVGEQWNSEKSTIAAMSVSGSPGEFTRALSGHGSSTIGVWTGDGAPGWIDGGVTAPGQSLVLTFVSFRYVKLGLKLFTGTDGDDYAGSNHPTITVRIDVTT